MRPEGWHERTPQLVRNGCYLLPALVPVWNAFGRAHRWRQSNPFNGAPYAVPLEAIKYAADGCNVAGLDRAAVMRLLIEMDDEALAIIRERQAEK